jgi:hypothetical protein
MKLVTIVIACTSAGAFAQPKPPPPPPSTGKEMPAAMAKKISAQEHRAVLEAALAEAKKPSPSCAQIANPKTSTAWFALPVPSKATLAANVDAYVALARCAEKEQFFKLEKDIGYYLVEAGTTHWEIEARGKIGMGDLKGAIGVLNSGMKKAPKDPNLLLTAAKVECSLDNWSRCASDAAAVLKNLGSLDPKEKLGVETRALKYLARASVHLGALAEAKKFADQSEKTGGNKAEIAEIRSLVTQAEIHKALVEPKIDPDVPLGLYHLYGKIPKAELRLVQVQVTNVGASDAQYKIEAGIEGVTQKGVHTVTLAKGKSSAIELSPPLAIGFDASKVRAAQAAQIMLKVTASTKDGDKVVFEQGLPVTLQPRDFLPTSQRYGNDAAQSTLWTTVAWITPNSKPIDQFLQKAKARAPRATFSGEQSATFEQVKAIYEELQAEGMSYVMDPYLFENGALHGQRTRLPSEVLASTNAQCLEGTLLYATLLEAIGIKPVVVTVPGHAFVGWFPSAKDTVKSKAKLFFLETTATHDAKFERAVDFAVGEFLEHAKEKKANVIEVAKLRQLGVSPQPVD